jgi:hypothetical protein
MLILQALSNDLVAKTLARGKPPAQDVLVPRKFAIPRPNHVATTL